MRLDYTLAIDSPYLTGRAACPSCCYGLHEFGGSDGRKEARQMAEQADREI